MKTNIYTAILSASALLVCMNTTAQTWRPKHAGLPGSFSARAVYGEGTRMIIVNNSPSTGSQIYYTPDSSTAFTGTTSSLGSFATMETGVVKCHGMHFAAGIGGVYKSSDNGVTWTITGASSAVYTFALYAYNDTLYAFMGNTAQLPYLSADDGATWTLIPGYTGTQVQKFLKHNGVLYLGGTSSFQYTSDNGATWSTVTTPGTLSGQNINGLVVFQGNVYASCVNGVFKTTDNGATWTNMTVTPMNCMAVVDSSLLCGTSTNGIYQSNQAATTWTQIATGLPLYISTLYSTINSISSNSQFVIASAMTDDSTIYLMRLSDLGLSGSGSTTAAEIATVQTTDIELTPNPAKDEVTVSMKTNVPGQATLVLYDVTGRLIKDILIDNAHAARLALTDVQTGIYFIQVTNSAGKAVKKLEVVR